MIDDPVAWRELAGLSRRKRTYLLRAVYVGGVGLLLWILWRARTVGVDALGVSDYADVGRHLFRGFYLFQMVFLSLAPAVTAFELFYREIKTGAVDLLLLTPRSAFSLTVGKWKAAMGEAAAIVVAGAPVLGACAFLGAVGVWDLLWAVSTALLQAGYAAAIAIRYAAQPRVTPPRLGDAVATVWFWQLAPVLLFLFAQFGVVVTAALHPLYAGLLALFSPDFMDAFPAYGWLANLVVGPLLIGRLLATAAAFDIRRIATAGAAPAVRVLPGAGGVSDAHPLLWKELRLREVGWALSGQRFLLLFFLTLFFVLLWAATRELLVGFAFVAFPLLVAMLFNGAFLFHQEEDRRRWDILLSTPLSPLRIVATKLAAGLLAPETLYLGSLLGLALLGWGLPLPGAGFLRLAAVVVLYYAFVYLLAAAASLYLGSRTSGGFLAAGLLFTLLAVLPWLRAMTDREGADAWRRRLDAAFDALHPVAAAAGPGSSWAFFGIYGAAVLLLLPLMVRRVARMRS